MKFQIASESRFLEKYFAGGPEELHFYGVGGALSPLPVTDDARQARVAVTRNTG